MMECQLHCLYGLSVSDETLSTDRQRDPAMPAGSNMCRGSNVKDMLATAFQLESLILAQNERWRHASYMQVERERPSGRVKWRTGE